MFTKKQEKECPECKGKGSIVNPKEPFNWHSHLDKERCYKCNGTGKIKRRNKCLKEHISLRTSTKKS